MFSPTGKAAICCGTRSSMEEVIAKFSQVTPQERTKRFGVFLSICFCLFLRQWLVLFYSLVSSFLNTGSSRVLK
jgi:hypothetical protein